ncbi:MAG TPA: hypothetical protein VHU62_14330 [Mycobacterium sp.]|nr:hypothetical protein [Mycobacterium sp.]
MRTVLMADCAGLWRRTLLVGADGSRDTGTDVVWLQGITAYVDSRGFAGRLGQRDAVFEWRRDIDITPPGPFPDAGRMRWEDGTLIEIGVHENYVEHWARGDGTVSPCGALFLRRDSDDAILLRVGEAFGWADPRGVLLGSIDEPEWATLSPRLHGSDLEANGVRWYVQESEGNVDL